MAGSETEYQSYLLRLWRPGAGAEWRVMLECIASGERHGFPDLARLFAFLRDQIGQAAPAQSDGDADF